MAVTITNRPSHSPGQECVNRDMRKAPVILITLAILLIGGRYIYGVLTRPDDATQVQAALDEAVKASREGRPGSVIDQIVDNFKVNDQDTSKRLIADFVKKNRPEVTILDREPVVSGDSAQITSDVKVKVDILGGQELEFKNAQFLFKKEGAMDWLIIPTTKWRLAAVRVDPADLPNVPSPWSQ